MNDLVATITAGCFAAGLNVYATVATLGLLGRAQIVTLPPQLALLSNDWVIGVSLVLFAIEFFADKIPVFDFFWNLGQTFVRVPTAALLAWAAASPLSPTGQLVAAIAGASVALVAHGGKVALRGAANTSPEPFSNIILSLIEDVTAIGLAWFAAEHPVIAATVAVILLVTTFFIIRWTWRFLKRSGRRLSDWLRQPSERPSV